MLSLHIAVILLGMTGLFAKFITTHLATIICGRTFFTVVAILPFLLFLRKRVDMRPKSPLIIVVTGIILSMHWYTFFHAIQLSTVAIGVIGFSTFPIFVTLLEPVLFKEKLRPMDIASCFVVFLGLYVIAPDLDFSQQNTIALAWAVLSGLLLAIYTLFNRQLVKSHYFLAITAYQSAVACIFTFPFVFFLAAWPSVVDYAMLALLGIVFTAIPQTLLVKGLKSVRAQVASILVGLEPVYSIIFAIILLNEIPRLSTLVGGVIVAIAVILAMNAHRQSSRSVEESSG